MTTTLTASFASALAASHEAAGPQHYPQGTLYVVATPIGNLADITLRALHVLSLVDAIACEDTRHTQALLRAYGIDRPNSALLALHQHNEQEAAERVVARLAAGERIAFVSDAGTPAISDPGARLVAAVHQAGLRTLPLPGASSVTTALSVAGLDSHQFLFEGFLGTRATERDTAIERLRAEPRAVVLLEAPHRIEALATSLAKLGERRVTVTRELTKQFESVTTMAASEWPAWLASDPRHSRGEFAVVLHPAREEAATGAGPGEQALQLLLSEGLPLKQAVKIAAQLSGEPRNRLYERALELRAGAADAS